MRKNRITFDDGSVIEWVDRETLKYSDGMFSVLIWVDFEPGFFSSGRIIKSSSIQKWKTNPDGFNETIDINKKQEIIEKVQLYYKINKRKCRVENNSYSIVSVHP